ncbi:unnamed protein product [Prunus armeniaca]|uniref:Uncharacterized protein n=1 Tax=Prunus armeniaca TaxID=36596 RepID=A0A6J5U181_PRUAR|nr:unnamed protein product [Prunus armeniaca]
MDTFLHNKTRKKAGFIPRRTRPSSGARRKLLGQSSRPLPLDQGKYLNWKMFETFVSHFKETKLFQLKCIVVEPLVPLVVIVLVLTCVLSIASSPPGEDSGSLEGSTDPVESADTGKNIEAGLQEALEDPVRQEAFNE